TPTWLPPIPVCEPASTIPSTELATTQLAPPPHPTPISFPLESLPDSIPNSFGKAVCPSSSTPTQLAQIWDPAAPSSRTASAKPPSARPWITVPPPPSLTTSPSLPEPAPSTSTTGLFAYPGAVVPSITTGNSIS